MPQIFLKGASRQRFAPSASRHQPRKHSGLPKVTAHFRKPEELFWVTLKLIAERFESNLRIYLSVRG